MLPKLTERESVVAHYLAGDLTLDGIARELGVSAGTVKSQTHAIYKKLGVGTRADAVRALGRSGFFNQVE
nr:LuxR C-terminal-related transcriptional regulator [Leucobacter luti]